ncbi:MAG: ThiF family adenylyltransferase [Nitrospira sp.]|nr:ThiF family adenylyltransferase [Nitrospira sp.]
MALNTTRYSRNIGLFGESGQARLNALRIAVIGLGGLGSHIVQQTAYLGVRRFILVDDDIVTLTNLNRLIGASEVDVQQKQQKVAVAERLVRLIQPLADILSLATDFREKEARMKVEEADVLFGCVDNDSARLSLTEFASRHRKPYMDLATDTGDDGGQVWYGGRILFAYNGTICLSCASELDQRAMAIESMTPKQHAEDRAIYGVPTDALNGTGPAVVSINGVVASLGVTEFMVWATGLREPKPHIRYRADLGRVTLVTDQPVINCYYCSAFRQ